jgi:hypothetical protein
VVDVNLTGVVPVHAAGVPRDEGPDAARRPHHQQRLDLGARAAAELGALHRDQARDHRADQVASLDGRKYDIACGQIDIGNAATEMTGAHGQGACRRPNGRIASSRDGRAHVADAVLHMASLPLDANVFSS